MDNLEEEKKVIDLPKILLYFFEIVILVLLGSYFYFAMIGNNKYEGIYSDHVKTELIKALFTSLKLQDIHEIPYLGITPKIQIYIQQETFFINSYYLEVKEGEVIIEDGIIQEKDIVIHTTEEEIQKIIEDENYIRDSLISGRTNIEKTTSDFVLFSKGYPDLFISRNAE